MPYDSGRDYVIKRSQVVIASDVAKDPFLSTAVAATGLPVTGLRMAHIESARDASTVLINARTARPLRVLPSFADREDHHAR